MSNHARNIAASTGAALLTVFLSAAPMSAQATPPTGGYEPPGRDKPPAGTVVGVDQTAILKGGDQTSVLKGGDQTAILKGGDQTLKGGDQSTVVKTGDVKTGDQNTVVKTGDVKTGDQIVKTGDTNVKTGDVKQANQQEATQTNQNGATASGNTTSFTDNSQFKAGSATSMNSAGVYVVKKCVASFSMGAFGGGVFGNYGGLSLSITPSGAVAMKNKDGDIFLLNDFADALPKDRKEMTAGMSAGAVKLASCLAMEWKESQANRTSDEAKTKYTVDGNVEIANVQADASVKVARIQAAGVIAETATKHVCNLGGQVEGNGKINTETLAHVRRHDTKGDPLPADSHENCEATLFYSLEVIGGEPVTTENTRRPRFKAHEVVPAREKQTTAPAAPASGASAPTPPGQ